MAKGSAGNSSTHGKLWALAISCGGRTPPCTYSIQEFAIDNRVIDTMYGFLTKSL